MRHASQRQVPHGKIADVMATVQEHYALTALSPDMQNTPAAFMAVEQKRPSSNAVAAPARTLAWAKNKAANISQEIFEVRLCFTCHEITKAKNGALSEGEQSAAWQITPV